MDDYEESLSEIQDIFGLGVGQYAICVRHYSTLKFKKNFCQKVVRL